MDFSNNPVLIEAMRRCGYSSFTDLPRDDDDDVHIHATRITPAIFIDTDHIMMRITWHSNGQKITYNLDDKGSIVTVHDAQFPEATLTGLAGKPLSAVVNVPGCEKAIIEIAVLSKAFVSDPLDLRMIVNFAD